jgi:hypothetical protein
MTNDGAPVSIARVPISRFKIHSSPLVYGQFFSTTQMGENTHANLKLSVHSCIKSEMFNFREFILNIILASTFKFLLVCCRTLLLIFLVIPCRIYMLGGLGIDEDITLERYLSSNLQC